MEYKVEDCFIEIKNGANIKQGNVNGGFPITRIETLADDKFNRDRMGYAGITEINKYSDYLLEDGDLLMSHINSPKYLGRTVVYHKQVDEVIIHGMNLLKLKVKRDLLVPDYAEYLFSSVGFRSQIAKIMKKSVNQASFSVSDLRKLIVDVPTLDEQVDIVAKLNKVRNIVSDRNAQMELLDNLIKSRFVELFGDPISNTYHWEMLSVEEMISKGIIDKPLDGNHGEKHPKASDYVEIGIPFIMANNLVNGKVDSINCNFISEEQANSLDKGFARNGDVLLTHKGTIGRTAIVESKYDFIMLTPQVTYYRPRRKIISEYLKAYFDTNYFQTEIMKIAGIGSTRAYIGITAQLKLLIMLPPLDLQSQFTIFVQHVDKLKVEVQKSLNETQRLFDSLMQKYFE